MPQRFLKPGLISSPKWDDLTWRTQSFYVRLLTLVDDFGRYEANPALLKSMAFPLRSDIRASDVTEMSRQLHEAGLAIRYTVAGKDYLQITNWTERARSEISRFPEPPQDSAADRSGPQPPKSSSSSKSSIIDARAAVGELEIPSNLKEDKFLVAWAEWIQFRWTLKAIKDPVTLFRKQLEQLAIWGPENAVASLNASMMNGWQGIFAPRPGSVAGNGSSSSLKTPLDCDNVLKSIQNEIERIRGANENRLRDDSHPQGWRLKPDAKAQIDRLVTRRDDVRKTKAGLK